MKTTKYHFSRVSSFRAPVGFTYEKVSSRAFLIYSRDRKKTKPHATWFSFYLFVRGRTQRQELMTYCMEAKKQILEETAQN